MDRIIIGSSAMQYHFEDFNRVPKDLDYAVKEKDKNSTGDIEYLLNPILFKYSKSKYLEPDLLLTLKMSHIFWNVNWDKHMFDIQFLLDRGCKVVRPLLGELYGFWCELHGSPNRSDLDQGKEAFFNNAINYDENEHDHIHLFLNPVPMYTRVLADGAEVDLDEDKFHALTHEDKLDFVREEVMVMAWERYRKYKFYVAYGFMLRKFIRQHVPIFAFDFAVENYKELTKVPYNFIKVIEDGLQGNK